MNSNPARYIAFDLVFILLSGLVLFTLLSGQGSLDTRQLTAPIQKTASVWPDNPGAVANTTANTTDGRQTPRATAGKTLMNSPLSFEANRGQFDSSVAFGARAAGGAVYLGAGEALIAPRNQKTNDPAKPSLRMRLLGARTAAKAEGVEPLRGRVNYLIGDDPRRWVTEAPTFARVRYREVYPGIDLVYYGAGRQLEYDWIVAPGASVARIKTVFDGAEHVRLDEAGDLMLRTAGGEARQRRPAAYQEDAGRRQPVVCRYVIEEGNQVGLEVGAYDRTRPLVIDPTLVFATFFGGAGDSNDAGYNPGLEDSFAIAVDGAGDIYIAGSTHSRTLPVRNAMQPEPGAPSDCLGDRCRDVFVAKLNQNGLIYSTYIGGASDEEAYDLAVDAAGSAYITGYTHSARFPVSDGAAQTFNRGYADAFVLKLAPSGSALAYGTYLGGAENDYGYSLAVDKGGYVYVTGATRSPDFPLANAFQARLGSGFLSDAFVAKLDPLGTGLIYSTYFGGVGSDGGNGIAVDDAGNVYLTGATTSPDFPVRRAIQRYYVPGYDSDLGGPLPDIFISKLDAAGRELVFSTYLGSYGRDVGNGIAIDRAGNVYVAGFAAPNYIEIEFPLVNPLPLAYRFLPHRFPTTGVVVKLSADGEQLLYSTLLGGVRYVDQLNDIAVDAAGRIYVTGTAGNSDDFPLTGDALDLNLGRYSFDAFLSVLDPNRPGMAALLYSTFFGGIGQESGNALALDGAGNVYLTGSTTLYGDTRPNNLPTVKPLQSYGPASDAFVAKIAPTFDNSADPVAPTITITSPTMAGEFTTDEAAVDLAGTAADNQGVTLVMWTSDRVGVGLAQGTGDWSIKKLQLLQGRNRITVTARDAVGNTASAVIEVNFQAPYVISTVAGGVFEFSREDDIGDGGLAVGAILRSPRDVLADAAGNLYIADNDNARIRKVTPAGVISTFAGSGQGGFGGDGGPATAARVNGLGGMALDARGNFYFTDEWNYRVRKVTPAGVVTTVAGSGDPWPADPQSSGDGGPATQARLNHPSDVAVDAAGNLYINDSGGFRIRKVDTNGIITTIAGTGVEGATGDGGPAIEARISGARSLSFDSAGNLYFISGGIRRISPDGRISTLPNTTFDPPFAVRALAVDSAGNIYFNETHRVRLRDTAGNFKTLAGRGGEGALGGDTAALAAHLSGLIGITLDGKGNVYVVDSHRVLKLSPAMTGDRSAPTVTITAPTAGNNFNSDLPFIKLGGTAADDRGVFQVTWRNNRGGSGAAAGTNTWQALNLPLWPGANEITVTARDAEGNTGAATLTVNYRLDTTPPNLTITSPTNKNLFETTEGRLAGGGAVSDDVGVAEIHWRNDRGQNGFAEVTGRAWRIPEIFLQAGSNQLTVTALDFAGNAAQARLEIVYRPEYLIETYAGRAALRYFDLTPSDVATQTMLSFPREVALDAAGNLFIAEHQPGLIRKITPAGTISLVAGGGGYGDGGDGGPAVDAQLRVPRGVAVDAAGNIYIAEDLSFKIRKVATDGKITTFAGTGEYGYGGDGGPATQAKLRTPRGMAADGAGNLYFADQTNHRVRKISSAGVITTFAGNGVLGFSGDGGLATNAQLNDPTDVALDAAGNVYITDSSNGRVRKVSPAGVITTIAGNGAFGFGGDGGPATSAQLGALSGVALDAASNIFLSDPGYNRIRKINPAGVITTIAGYDERGLGVGGFGGDGGAAALAKLQQPSDLVVDRNGNIFVADEFNFRIRKLTPYAPNAQPVTSVSAASFAGNELAVEAITAAFGANLATRVEIAASAPLPATLAGTTVKVRDSQGAERPAPIFFVSPNQINYQIPKGTATGLATVKITSGNGAVSTGVTPITTIAPSLFSANSDGRGVAAAVVLRIRGDGSQSYEPAAEFNAAQNRFIARPIDLGPSTPSGDQVFLILFGTGLRNRSALSNVTARIGGVNAEVLFAGPQGAFVGLDQINLRLPRSLAGRGEVDVEISVDLKTANKVKINVK